jgi:hypothetical protein
MIATALHDMSIFNYPKRTAAPAAALLPGSFNSQVKIGV